MDIYWWVSVPVYSQYRLYLCGFFFNFWRTKVLLWGHWYPCFGLLVTCPLVFKNQSGQTFTESHLTSIATSADLLAADISSTSVSVRNVYEVDLGLDTLVSRHRDVISIWKIELKSFLQMNTHDFVILFDVMQFSQDVQMDLAMWVKSRNECGRWRHCAKYSVLCRNECHH